ncbi:VWD domain-containing protein, partial [Salmonella sp. s54395]|uniref:VWD domain-containing protein n=2 Tax=unclassified Salmonella TaxID=2614656 RepID=UPI003980452A
MNRLILPSQYQIERLAELIKTRYEELMTYITSQIEENRPLLEKKLAELRLNIKDTRQKIEEMRAEFSWLEFKQNVTEKYNQAKEFVQEKYPILVAELKANVTLAIDHIKVNYPIYIEQAKALGKNLTEMLKRYQEEFPETVSELLSQISDLTKQLYLPTDLPPLIKPWTYTSMIFGEGHVMTFDGHVYEFPVYTADECTYLLARDFTDSNFTLLVKKSTTVLVLDTLTVEIDSKGLFFINGNAEPRSPPFESHNKDVVVTRDGPWTNVTTIYGIELNCHTNHFMCVYRLSGWYYS